MEKPLIAGAHLATRKFHFKPFLLGCQSHMLVEIHHMNHEKLVFLHWILLKCIWIPFGFGFHTGLC